MGFKDILLFYVRANQLLISFFTLIIFFIHLDNAIRPRNFTTGDQDSFCDTIKVTNADLDCVGGSLVWMNGDNPVSDYNKLWRTIFTFNIGFNDSGPVGFIDVWTPFVFAMLGLLVHFGFEIKIISESWMQVFFFYLASAMFAQYGYAGNMGIFWGMWTSVAFLPFVLICPFLVREEPTHFSIDLPSLVDGQKKKREERIVRRRNSRARLKEGFQEDTTAKSKEGDHEPSLDEEDKVVSLDVYEDDENEKRTGANRNSDLPNDDQYSSSGNSMFDEPSANPKETFE